MKRSLTKRENQIMMILWNSSDPLSANEIYERDPQISMRTIQQVLQKLLKMDLIKVDGIGRTKNAITRLYTPTISQADYIATILSEENGFLLISNLIKQSSNVRHLEEIDMLLQEKLNELKNNV